MNDFEVSPKLQPEFYKSQYEGLRREIELNLTEARSVERNAALASGAVWAWLATNGTPQEYGWCWFIPVAFTILGALRSIAIGGHFGLIATYLRLIEGRVCDPGVPGWETFRKRLRISDDGKNSDFQRLRKEAPSPWQYSIGRTGIVFWVVMLLMSIVIGCKGFTLSPKAPPNPAIAVTCK